MVWALEQFLQERVERGRRLLEESGDHRGSTDLQVHCRGVVQHLQAPGRRRHPGFGRAAYRCCGVAARATAPAAAAPHSPAAALQDESGPAGRCHRVREAAGPYEGPGCRSLLAELQRCRLL
jgi:hypothetical protein